MSASIVPQPARTFGPPWPVEAPHSAWLTVPLYLFVGFSTFSIAGTTLAEALLLVGLLLVRPTLPCPPRDLGRMLLPFFALVAAVLLSQFANPHPWENIGHAWQYRLILLPAGLLWTYPHVDLRRTLQVLCVLVIVMGLWALPQFLFDADPLMAFRLPLGPVGPFFRAQGTFSHPLTYSGYMLIAAPLLGALAMAETGRARWMWLAGGVAAALGVGCSVSRSSTLGLCAAGLVLLSSRWPRLALALLVAACLAIATLATGTRVVTRLVDSAWVQRSPLLDHFVDLDPRHNVSARERLLLWEAGLRGFLERPVLGFGLDRHNPELGPYQHRVLEAHGIPDYLFTVGFGTPPHNIYIGVLFDLGLVGAAAYLWLWGSVLVAIRRGLRAAAARDAWSRALLWGALAGLAGSMVAGVFEDNFFDGEVQALIVFTMTLTLYVSHRVRTGAPATGIPGA
jgi:O-antigen ligase